MATKAIARFVRLGPRKVGQVLDLIRGKGVLKAYQILRFNPRQAAKAVEKVLQSAVANTRSPAEEPNLYVAEAYVGQGPVLKRVSPRAMGRAAIYRRKTCHIYIAVENRKAFARGQKVGTKGSSSWNPSRIH